LVLALGSFAVGTDSFVVARVMPEITCGFHVDIGAPERVTPVIALTFALLVSVIAALAANAPHRHLLRVGLGVFVIANMAAWVVLTAMTISIGLGSPLSTVIGGLCW
jgi:DHA1 family inner membrane transport protein